MSQLLQFQADQLYPEKSEKIWFLTHVLNHKDALSRCLKSVEGLTDNVVVLVDDRTTDDVQGQRFKWKHSFSYAKNLCLAEAMKRGLKFGDWVLFMGADFELQQHTIPEMKEFVKDPLNFFAQFWVPEFGKEGEKVVTRKRKIFWRHHPLIFWERCVHEEACYSAYRLSGQGIPFGDIEWKEFPVLGGNNGMIHYGYHEDGGENGTKFWGKKGYYLVLYQIDRVRNRYQLAETEEGMRQALSYILNRPVLDINEAVEGLTKRYQSGDIPKGLAEIFSPEWLLKNTTEYAQ